MKPVKLIYTALGLGLIPRAPGTFGALLGLPLYWLMADWDWRGYLAATAALFFIGWWAANQAEKDFGRHDDPRVVIDEVVGYLVTMFAAPYGFVWMIWGFLLFRLFDIWKPWPVRWADRRTPGGLGVMLDDVLAGVYAWLVMQFLPLAWGVATLWLNDSYSGL